MSTRHTYAEVSARNETLRRLLCFAAELDASGEPFPDIAGCLAAGQDLDALAATTCEAAEDCRPDTTYDEKGHQVRLQTYIVTAETYDGPDEPPARREVVGAAHSIAAAAEAAREYNYKAFSAQSDPDTPAECGHAPQDIAEMSEDAPDYLPADEYTVWLNRGGGRPPVRVATVSFEAGDAMTLREEGAE